ncbi:hypothetical protein IKQ26_05305 [bacterium]|nr:hypothetical protein [bacterium]
MITLVIIGVIAALTVPTVMNKINEQRTVSGVKTAYSKLAQAIQKAQISNGSLTTWSVDSPEDIFKLVKPNLQIMKECGYGSGCFPDVTYKYLDNREYINIDTRGDIYKFILNDGTLVVILIHRNKQGMNFWFDINGPKGPNQWAKDLFLFPVDFTTGKISVTDNSYECYKDNTGLGCAGWILKYNNTDYPATTPE